MKIKISIIQPALAKNAIFWPRRPPCNGFNLALLVFADDRKSSIKYQRVLVFVSADDQKSSQKYKKGVGACFCLEPYSIKWYPLVIHYITCYFLFIDNNIATQGVGNHAKTIELIGIQIISFL